MLLDARKQSKMAILSKERDRLQHSIEAYQSMFMTHKKLVDALKRECFVIINVCSRSVGHVMFFCISECCMMFADAQWAM